MRTIRAVLEYDGSDFCGLQFQPQLRSVAGVVEAALSELMREPIKLTAAGRTDAGVHATGQVISFKTAANFPIDRLPIALNSVLPPDVSVRAAAVVGDDFSARFSAIERTYLYVILNRATPSAVLRRYAHHVYQDLSVEAMRAGAAGFLGEHDFLSLCGVLPEHGPTIRTIHAIDLERRGDLLRVRVRGDGFLHRMIRILCGTLIEMGSGRRDPHGAAAILSARDRRAAGYTAPAAGLFFIGVRYPDFDSLAEPRFAACEGP